MADLDPSTPAKLFRSRADWPEEMAGAQMEEVGSGPLAKMIRLVLSDPDDEVWRYSILASGQSIDGEAIRAVDRKLGGRL